MTKQKKIRKIKENIGKKTTLLPGKIIKKLTILSKKAVWPCQNYLLKLQSKKALYP